MSQNSGNPSDNGENGATADTAAIEKLVEQIVGKALSQRLPRVKNTEEIIAAKIAEALAKAAPAEKAPAMEQPVSDGNDRLTLKSLQEKHDAELRSLRGMLEAEQKQRLEADQRAKAAALRARVQSEVAKYLPADSPHHNPYMTMLYDTQGRFGEVDGQPVVKFRREWDPEHPVPLEQGVKELFETELKHLVHPSKADRLPKNPANGLRGMPLSAQSAGDRPRNPLHEVAAAYYKTQGEHGISDVFAASANGAGEQKK